MNIMILRGGDGGDVCVYTAQGGGRGGGGTNGHSGFEPHGTSRWGVVGELWAGSLRRTWRELTAASTKDGQEAEERDFKRWC